MPTHITTDLVDKKHTAQFKIPENRSLQKPSKVMVDNRSETVVLQRMQTIANESSCSKRIGQLKTMANNSTNGIVPIQNKNNSKGLPDKLESGIENVSSYAMDDLKKHRNSEKHAQLKGKVNGNEFVKLKNEGDKIGVKGLDTNFYIKNPEPTNATNIAVTQRIFSGKLNEMPIDKIIGEIDEKNQALLARYSEVTELKSDVNKTYHSIDEIIEAIKEMRVRKNDREIENDSSEDMKTAHDKEFIEGEIEEVGNKISRSEIRLVNSEESGSDEESIPIKAMGHVRNSLLKTKEAGNLSVSSREAKLRAKQADFAGLRAFRKYKESDIIRIDSPAEIAKYITQLADIKGDKNYNDLAELIVRAMVLEHAGGGYCDHLSAATFLELVKHGKKPIWIRYVPKSDEAYNIKGPHEEANENYHRSVGLVNEETNEFMEIDSWVPDGGRIRVFENFDKFLEDYGDTMEVLWEWKSTDKSFLQAARNEIDSRLDSPQGKKNFTYVDDGESLIELPVWTVEKK